MTTTVIVETMPEHLRSSHRAARNWGVYPANGAERQRVEISEAKALCEEDGGEYNHIVEGTEKTAGKYTYSIFDSNPATSSVDAWPSHDDLEIEAESDDDAIEMVRSELEIQAVGLNVADGYEVGQRLYAQLMSNETCCIVDVITHDLTTEDLA